MMRLPRFLPSVASVCLVSVPLISGSSAWAQEAPAPAAAAAPANAELRSSVENFWHYAKIGKYDLAKAEAQKILAQKDQPVAVLEAFENVTSERKDNLDQWLLRFQSAEPVKKETTELIKVLSDGYRARRADQKFIEENIKRLPVNERAYATGIARLRESGEQAVPLMLDYLRDPARKEYHVSIRRALHDMGRLALNPLVAATEMKDAETLTMVVAALGDIGYDASVPYLARLANDPQASPAVVSAATQALMQLGAGDPKQLNSASLFYSLAEKFYYNNAAIAADNRSAEAYIWCWDNTKGLVRKSVSPAIFADLMAMRACEYTLKLDPNRSDAVSLWLAANYKREADLPQGVKDPTRAEGQPDAHYYGVSAGSQYLNAVLTRALADRNSAVALKAIKSLQEIVGQSNLFAGGQPIIDAMHYPDRAVRFEAAFAVAAALPQKAFTGQEQVVPVLAEAVAQNGKPSVLVVMGEQDQVNGMIKGLQEKGYVAAGATSADAAVAAAETLPAVDVMVISESVKNAEIDRLFQRCQSSPRLQGAARLVIVASSASPFAAQASSNPLISVTQASKPADLEQSLAAARQKAGALPLDEKAAADYALRSANLLGKLAISRGQVLDLSAAEKSLLAALDDSRPEVIKASGNVLGLTSSKPAQVGLLVKATDEKTSDEVKVSLYKSLAISAKFFGNQLDAGQVATLQKAVASEKNAEVRSAAAEAHGALNLPADQAKKQILEQSR